MNPLQIVKPPKNRIKPGFRPFYDFYAGWFHFQAESDIFYNDKRRKVKNYIAKARATATCKKCGTKANLTFHHLDKTNKKNISQILTVSRLKEELKKGIFLCRKCHDEEEGIIQYTPQEPGPIQLVIWYSFEKGWIWNLSEKFEGSKRTAKRESKRSGKLYINAVKSQSVCLICGTKEKLTFLVEGSEYRKDRSYSGAINMIAHSKIICEKCREPK